MSIFSTWLSFDDDSHEPSCGVYERMPDGQGWQDGAAMQAGEVFYRRVDRPCTCPNKPPLAYLGSHVNPSDDGPRGGVVDVAAIPNHCHPSVRGLGTDAGPPVEFLRLSVREGDDTYGDPEPGYAQVVLDRRQVEELHKTLTHWLETEERL